jgi:drug/metabolite transporter (DMT)-like permease
MTSKGFLSFILLLAALIWGGSFVVVKIAVAEMDPLILGAARFIIATPLMFLILFARRSNLRLPRREWPWLVVLGLTGVTLLYVFQYIGIAYTNASISSVLTETDVLFIALFSILFLKEVPSRLRIVGILLSFVGVIVVILSNLDLSTVSISGTLLLGCILVILSSVCWGIFSIVSKRILQSYDVIVVTTYTFALGTLFYLPIVGGSIVSSLQQTSLLGWAAILYLALVSTIVAYLAWNYALQHMDASQAGVYLTFIALFTILIAVPLGEQLTVAFFIGAALIISGVYLTQKSR